MTNSKGEPIREMFIRSKSLYLKDENSWHILLIGGTSPPDL